MDEEKKTLKEKFEAFSEEAKWKAHRAAEWCRNNKDAVLLFGPVIAGGIIEMIRVTNRNHVLKEEKALKDRYIYDRSTGHYYELKRKPKNSEWLQIEQRKTNGESIGEILYDMGLLK